MESLVGRTLGRYELTAMIGGGGMATVYEGRHPGLDQRVAVKVLHPFLATDHSFVDRFRREAHAVAALRHPNIVRVLDSDCDGDLYFMVMEYIGGPTLSTVLSGRRAGGGLSLPEVYRIIPPLCSAVDYAAGRGMVHRDIKPANIIMTEEGEPILTDYGIAKMIGATSLTSPGTVVGSAHYMSPEQAQGQDCDVRSDLYSLGVVLFECLAGTVPFNGDTTATVLIKHITAPVPSIRSLRPNLPFALEPVLTRALAKPPRDRYESGAAFADELVVALTPSRATAVITEFVTPITPPPTAVERPASPPPTPPPIPPSAPTPPPTPPPPMTPPADSRELWQVGGPAAVGAEAGAAQSAAPAPDIPAATPVPAPPPTEFAAPPPSVASFLPASSLPPPEGPSPPDSTLFEQPPLGATAFEATPAYGAAPPAIATPGVEATPSVQTADAGVAMPGWDAAPPPPPPPAPMWAESTTPPPAPRWAEPTMTAPGGMPPRRSNRMWVIVVAIFAVVLVAAIGTAAALALRGGSANPSTTTLAVTTTGTTAFVTTTAPVSTTSLATTTSAPTTTTVKSTTTTAKATTTTKKATVTTKRPSTRTTTATTRRPTTTQRTSPPDTIGPGNTDPPDTIGPG